MSLEDRLDEIERRLGAIEAEWASPEVATDPDRMRRLGREQSQLSPVVENWRALRETRSQLAASRMFGFVGCIWMSMKPALSLMNLTSRQV